MSIVLVVVAAWLLACALILLFVHAAARAPWPQPHDAPDPEFTARLQHVADAWPRKLPSELATLHVPGNSDAEVVERLVAGL